ncbi:MAG TPA: DUF1707 domain-containing protein [Trebonia sp.]|nr:DUF1707 domain-containing protein [Trebonia sp.]
MFGDAASLRDSAAFPGTAPFRGAVPVGGPRSPGDALLARGIAGGGNAFLVRDTRPARNAIRVGDAERDVAARELGEHYAAGRLTLGELDERLELVLSARTRGQLTQVMADLPLPRTPLPRVAGQARSASRSAPAAPAPSARPARDRRERAARETVSQFAAVALLLLAMLIWLLTVLLFTSHG